MIWIDPESQGDTLSASKLPVHGWVPFVNLSVYARKLEDEKAKRLKEP
ncbi:MAG: hypothetical protein AAF412_11845 [Pseudomonadota bacterium]